MLINKTLKGIIMKKTLKTLIATTVVAFSLAATDANAIDLNTHYIEISNSNSYPYNIALAQSSLTKLGYYVGPFGSNGKMNTSTRAAIKRFQADYGLRVDGILGSETANALNSINYNRWYYQQANGMHNPYVNQYRYVPAGYRTNLRLY